MTLAFSGPEPVSVPIAGSGARFPVHRVYCVGRNYADHVREMGGEVGREPPFFFAKPPDALVTAGYFPYPAMTEDVHHEVELVVALGPEARLFGYAVGLDMTRRDLQAAAKNLGRPWEVAKSFDHSAPISPITASEQVLTSGAITLDVNGMRRQTGDISQMIWNIPEIITELAKLFTLKPGDLIFTGTPSGVSAVARGDKLHAEIAGVGTLKVDVI